MIIEDGTGYGYSAAVNSENKIKTLSTRITFAHHVNHDEGKCFTALFDQTPTGSGDCFFYLKNNDSEDLVVTELRFRVESNEEIYLKIKDEGTPVDGAAITPVNLNAESGNAADVTCQQGSDITGLSSGNIIDYIGILSSQGTKQFKLTPDIIIPKNHVFSIYAKAGAIRTFGTAVFYFHSSNGDK